MEFQADIVTFEPSDDEFISLAFFRSESAIDKHYLVISRCLEPGNEGGVALELDDQSRSTTDGILEWKLEEHRLTLTLESRAAKDLGIVDSPIIIVDLTIAQDSLDGLKKTLAAIFGESLACNARSEREKVRS